MSLFYSHFSSWKPVCNENYHCAGHAVDRFVGAIDRRFRSFPLLNCVCGSLFEVRRAREKVLSRKNMTPSLEDTLPSKTCIPGVSPGRGRACRRGVMISARLGRSVACLHYPVFNYKIHCRFVNAPRDVAKQMLVLRNSDSLGRQWVTHASF
jgi:hypothetical protein